MSRPSFGRSIYYASDKNIFDALNQHKVDTSTIVELFRSRNTIVSKHTPREVLADYFSLLNHDYYDQKQIAIRLGTVAKRERITSMEVQGITSEAVLSSSIDQVKRELEKLADVVQLNRSGKSLKIHVQYELVDYKKSEFRQVQVRDGTVEFIAEDGRYIVRNTKNEYLDDVRDRILARVALTTGAAVVRNEVSLFDFPDHIIRTSFFYDLISSLPGYVMKDVTAVYVFKPAPSNEWKSEQDDDEDFDTHVERIHLKGHGVSRSSFLSDLGDDEYYVTKIVWRAKETLGNGSEVEIEALFLNPKDCTDFSFILLAVFVYDSETGKVAEKRRTPERSEIDVVSRVVERRAKELMDELRAKLAKANETEQ